MGLGLLGRGLGVVKFLAECGADLLVTDLKTKEQLAPSLAELSNYKNITFILGEHRLEDFRDGDLIIKAAGVPLNSIYVAEAVLHGVPVKMESSLFAKFTKATLIGVTGTRGKSTTTHFIYESLKKFYKNGKVFIGGNVKGIATLPLLKEADKNDVVVLELDSWQLQGFGDEKISPHIAVFTNFLPDHLNYYMKNGDSEAYAMELYFSDKANIFRHQNKSDYLIVSGEMAHYIVKKYPLLQSEIVAVTEKDLLPDWHLNIPGEHNRENLVLGASVLRVIGCLEDEIKLSVESFKGVSGRLELIREKDGIKIFNDTTSTTPVAGIVALKSIGNIDKKNIVLIMGGANKQIDMIDLINILPQYCSTVVLLPGTGTDTVREKIKKNVSQTIEVDNLQDAVSKAMNAAKTGDIVLFSPSFASFGLFQNEFDRGEQFEKLIKNLK